MESVNKRAMNNKEKQGYQIVKESVLSYELKYIDSPWTPGYVVSVHLLMSEYKLDQIQFFQKDLARYKELA